MVDLLAMTAEAVYTSITQRLRAQQKQVTPQAVRALIGDYTLRTGEAVKLEKLIGREQRNPCYVGWFMALYEKRDRRSGWQARGKKVRKGETGRRLSYFTAADAAKIRRAAGNMQRLAKVFSSVQQFESAVLYSKKQVR